MQVSGSSDSFLSYIDTSAELVEGPQGLALTSEGRVVVANAGSPCFKTCATSSSHTGALPGS